MAMLTKFLEFVVWFGVAFIFGSLVEYSMHRFMHYQPRLCKVHTEHHRRNEAQGVFGEFTDYLKGSFPLMCMMFLSSWEVGISFFLGMLSYAAFAAYAHQLQHENPTACFWMKMPVHYVHHEYKQWHHNFGLGVDWWDRIFGTYKPVEWLTEKEQNLANKSPFEVKWH